MKRELAVVTAIFLLASFCYAGDPTFQDSTYTSKGKNIIADIGLSTLKVTGQIVTGFLGGIVGGAVLNMHPVTSGIGWIMGSSAGVYLVGNLSGGRGSYWWTVVSGAVPVLSFIIPLDKAGDSFSAGAIILGAALVTLTTEIVGYYISKPFVNENKVIKTTYLKDIKPMDLLVGSSRLKLPVDISIDIIRFNF